MSIKELADIIINYQFTFAETSMIIRLLAPIAYIYFFGAVAIVLFEVWLESMKFKYKRNISLIFKFTIYFLGCWALNYLVAGFIIFVIGCLTLTYILKIK